MSRARADLCDGRCSVGFDFRAAHANVVADCAEEKTFLLTVDTVRTPAEQELNLRRGRSKTLKSLHLPQRECGMAHAFDVVPVLAANDGRIIKLDWDAEEPEWNVIASVALRHGLRAGFTKRNGKRWDLGHLQQPGARARL